MYVELEYRRRLLILFRSDCYFFVYFRQKNIETSSMLAFKYSYVLMCCLEINLSFQKLR